MRYYRDLFKEEEVSRTRIPSQLLLPPLDNSTLINMGRPISYEEIRNAVFNIGGFKAPSDDGLPAIFDHNSWNVAEKAVTIFVKDAWSNHELIKEVNNTLLVLIPKIDNPESISQFQPVSLYNVIYKCITMAIVNRIKPFLDRVVSPFQASFVPGRNIQDNIIIAKEMMHSMNKMKERKKFMVIKIDLEKAYDRLNWDFIRQCLQALNFSEEFIQLIMACMTSSTLQVLWNCDRTEKIIPSKGLRQGDPLYPYIFVICMDILSIGDAINKGIWNPMRAGRRGPSIFHLIFADELLLFPEASIPQMNSMLQCLDFLCSLSGQKVTTSKTCIYFSKNVNNLKAASIVGYRGFKITKDLARYLGATIQHGRNSIHMYKESTDKIHSRLSGWKSQCLSLAGRITLANSILGSLAYFRMQHEKIPKAICRSIEKAKEVLFGDMVLISTKCTSSTGILCACLERMEALD